MRKCIGSALLLTVLSVLPAFAAAQRRAVSETGPKNELGVDLAFQYVSYGSNGGSGVQLAAPVDASVGWLSRSVNMFEARAAVSWDSNLGAIVFAPGVNVLHALKRGSGTRGLMRAPYVTAGLGHAVRARGGRGEAAAVRQRRIPPRGFHDVCVLIRHLAQLVRDRRADGLVVLALSGFAEARPRPPAPAGGPFPFTAVPRNDRRPHGYPVSHSL